MKYCKKCDTETEHNAHGGCRVCVRANSAKWAAANRDRVRATTKAWADANQDKLKSARTAWSAANKERERSAIAAWNAANKDKGRAAAAKYRAAHPEKARQMVAAWRKNNPEADRVHRNNRRARKLQAGGSLSSGLAARLFKLQRGKCACGCAQPLGDGFHLDHIMPLALGGTNTDDNIQLLRSTCNQQKHAKHPIEFMQQRGFLI